MQRDAFDFAPPAQPDGVFTLAEATGKTQSAYVMTSRYDVHFAEDEVFTLTDEGRIVVQLPLYLDECGQYEFGEEEQVENVETDFGGFYNVSGEEMIWGDWGNVSLLIPRDSALGRELIARELVFSGIPARLSQRGKGVAHPAG